ncbi:hypothetical protein L9F63_013377, partial [Diploptera punctata]
TRSAKSDKKAPVTAILFFALLRISTGATCDSTMEYDFIIVGGGTAGCLLAHRLSEVEDWKILLLEVGNEGNMIQDIPLFQPIAQSVPWWTFKYTAEKSDNYALSMRNGRISMPAGKVLGGTSAINGMVYNRGNQDDFDQWEKLGNIGWSYDDVLPYFFKHENTTIFGLNVDRNEFYPPGELNVQFPPHRTHLVEAFVKSGQENGHPFYDYNPRHQIGFTYTGVTIKHGERLSSYNAFLSHSRKRKNLTVMTRSMVTKILIDETDKKAYGVEFKRSGVMPIRVCAEKEVIVCGGTMRSPQLLMLSGIGPRDHLEDLNIPVLQDSKVGYNYRDQVTILNLFFTINESVGIEVSNFMKSAHDFNSYLSTRKGPFSVPAGFEGFSFLDLDRNDGIPDVELFFGSLLVPAIPFSLTGLGPLSDELNAFYSPLVNRQGFTILPFLLRPESVGRLKLRNSNPFFTSNGIKEAVKLTNTAAFKRYNAQLFPEPLPNCSKTFGSDSYWECCARHSTLSGLHGTGTCKMGPRSDPDAVVDPSLRVIGIKNLRVADASIMPTLTSGHTMAPVYMIAEKAADMIKKDWLV